MKLIALLVAFAASLASATDTTQMELSCEQRLAQIPKIIDEATFQRAARFAASPAARRAAPPRPFPPRRSSRSPSARCRRSAAAA